MRNSTNAQWSFEPRVANNGAHRGWIAGNRRAWDRKWGKHTARVGRRWLVNIAKTKNGVVSVTSLLADGRVYLPIVFEPYTLAHHFAEGKADPKFRTKLKIAAQLVEQAIVDGIRFRVVVAYSFYGEEEDFKRSLSMVSVASRACPAPARTSGCPWMLPIVSISAHEPSD